jgi:hypothetical protein
VLVDMPERQADGLAHAQQPLRHQPRRVVVAADDAVAEALGKRPGDPMAQWRHEVDPEAS